MRKSKFKYVIDNNRVIYGSTKASVKQTIVLLRQRGVIPNVTVNPKDIVGC